MKHIVTIKLLKTDSNMLNQSAEGICHWEFGDGDSCIGERGRGGDGDNNNGDGRGWGQKLSPCSSLFQTVRPAIKNARRPYVLS